MCKMSFFTEDFASSEITLTLCILGIDRYMTIVGKENKVKITNYIYQLVIEEKTYYSDFQKLD